VGAVSTVILVKKMGRESQRWFYVTCGFELSLLLLAGIIAGVLQRGLFAGLQWDLEDALWGVSASLPPLAVFFYALKSAWKPLVEIRDALDRTAGRLFGNFSIIQLFTVSALAGICEEALFRSVVQGGLETVLGRMAALFVASTAFGFAHLLNWSYGWFSFLAGLYLGGLWLATDNLLTPMITHGLYDFLALVYYLRICQHDYSREFP
jgi:membrane protease YdiL (CAAX protease family)